MTEHGGRLLRAARRYGIPAERWLDLSTGINPHGWRGAPPAFEAWSRLPEDEDGLAELAAGHYGAPRALPVAGTQAAIQWLPRLRAPGRVGIVAPTYAEHALRWRLEGHAVELIGPDEAARAAAWLDVLVVVNPNNPSGRRETRAELLRWHAALAPRGGWLIVDEAYADAEPGDSLAAETVREGLIVLRSLGKFYGLAGARVGFVLAAAPLLARLAEWIGPWSVAGPSRALAAAALADRDWQARARRQLLLDGPRLAALLARHGLAPDGGCALFQWTRRARAAHIAEALARQAILVRVFEEPAGLRLGLPGDETGWTRLDEALAALAPVAERAA